MTSFPDLAAFAAAYPTLTGTALGLAHQVCQQSDEEIRFFNQQLNQHKLIPQGWQIELMPASNSEWQHQITKADTSNHYQLQNSQTLAASALSVALELAYLDQCAKAQKIAKSKLGKEETSLSCWFADLNQADPASMTLALDTVLLVYFHQVSQVMFGHMALPEPSLVERRALITDADFNAGTMFCLWLDYHQTSSRIPADTDEAIQRLINAAYLLAVLDKQQSNNKNALHFASNRVNCFVSGAVTALHEMEKGKQFASEEDELQQQISELSQWIEAALLDSSLSEAVGSDADIERDEEKLQGETASIRAELKAGPLVKLAFN
ncbi:hypothetical protein [Motilimonas sp. KMU-193]|uniref:hypothetical protein n=1 Tax=Motilimonas sp. KMU-193 TaxID=3388668 RepID=UPI00396B10BE